MSQEKKPYSLCYYSSSGMELSSLSEGILTYRKNGGEIKVTARSQIQLFDKAQKQSFVRTAMAADMVIISLHGGKASLPAFDLLIKAMAEAEPASRPHLHIQPSGGDEDSLSAASDHGTGFDTVVWDTIKQYLERGGHLNMHRLLIYLHNVLFAGKLHCPPPLDLVNEGIYHPDFDGVPELGDYLGKRVDPTRLTVGLWFHQTYWVNNNLAFIDAIIRSIEAEGANVIPVFHLRYKDTDRGNNGADYIVDHFFMAQGKPRIQVLINPLLFSLSLAAPEYKNLLAKLAVPCIQAMMSMSTYAVWRDSEQGMSTADVNFAAAQPEFDGNLITVPVATREQDTIDPVSGGLLAKSQPIPERIDKLVRLSLNWAKLSWIKNRDRKVAIIFHHYPPRNDRIGCAAGLDSFFSVKLLLDRMAEEGYKLARTFASGDELAHELLRKMTADQRWLTPDQMVERAEAHAGAEHYIPWNKELPDSVRQKTEKDWGKPPGDLFVYDDQLYFAGLLNENVFISIQPPRGYFENIDKVYHDLHLSVPHHYLAQYHWIRDVFRADVVMHVGKHGSLEWLPEMAGRISRTGGSIAGLAAKYPWVTAPYPCLHRHSQRGIG